MITDLPTPISTSGPPVDVPLLRKAVEWAEAEAAKPEGQRQWNQALYVSKSECGTAYCIAGYVAHLLEVSDIASMASCATAALGVTDEEAFGADREGDWEHGLFNCGNTITDVRTAAERIAARVGERL